MYQTVPVSVPTWITDCCPYEELTCCTDELCTVNALPPGYCDECFHDPDTCTLPNVCQDPNCEENLPIVDHGHDLQLEPCCQTQPELCQHLPEINCGLCRWLVDGEPCGYLFDDKNSLQQHVEDVHLALARREDDNGTAGFFCQWQGCKRGNLDPSSGDEGYYTSPAADSAVVDRRMKCFPAKAKLRRHVMIHTGWEPFKCQYPGCNVSMKTQDAITKHERTHTGEKPYMCAHEGCGKAFTTSTELKTHETTHTGHKRHVCHLCGERFADSSNLSKHRKIHYNAQYVCEECGVSMKRPDQMKRHFAQKKHMRHLLLNPMEWEAWKERCASTYNQQLLDKLPRPKRGKASTSPDNIE